MINNIINHSKNSLFTKSINDLVGGSNQEWKMFLENIGRNHVEQSPHMDGEDMVKYAYDLNEKRVYYPP